MNNILVTGGAGFIGSHACLELLKGNYKVIVLDDFSNSSPESILRVESLTDKKVNLVEGDVRDSILLDKIFEKHKIDGVIHFAGSKSVSESNSKPLDYYDNNVSGTVTLCKVMAKHGCKNLVFSSSATVYGVPKSVPIHEGFPTSTINPYGSSKLMVENVLKDLSASDENWGIVILRYFNPIGAHYSGLIGEDPNDIPNNLIPYISQVAIGKLKQLTIHGNDYATVDGTGVRDYIHVVDLARGHLHALDKLNSTKGCLTYNLGTGKGYTVLEVIKEFAKVSGLNIPYSIGPRRAGDVAECWANPDKSKEELAWEATLGLTEMLRDAWNWQRKNPLGYHVNND